MRTTEEETVPQLGDVEVIGVVLLSLKSVVSLSPKRCNKILNIFLKCSAQFRAPQLTRDSPSDKSSPSLGPSTTTPQKKARLVTGGAVDSGMGFGLVSYLSPVLNGTTLRGEVFIAIVSSSLSSPPPTTLKFADNLFGAFLGRLCSVWDSKARDRVARDAGLWVRLSRVIYLHSFNSIACNNLAEMVSTRGSKARQNGAKKKSKCRRLVAFPWERDDDHGSPAWGVSSKAAESGSQASNDIEVSSLFSHLRIGMAERLGSTQKYIENVSNGVVHLRREVKHLRSQNEELQTRIEALHEADNVSIQPKRGKRGGESLESLKSKVKK